MNPLITKIQQIECRFEEMTNEKFIPKNTQGIDEWLEENTDKHLFQNNVYNEPMFDLSIDKVKSFHRSSLISLFQANIERLECMLKKVNNGEELPFENSPEIYCNARIEAYKRGFNQAIYQEIAFMRETIKSLENE